MQGIQEKVQAKVDIGFSASSVIIVLLGGLLVYTSHALWRYQRQVRELRVRYHQLAIAANIYLFEYDIRTDVLEQSPACARLLRLPQRLEHYQQKLQEAKDPVVQQALQAVDTVIHGGQRSARVKMYRPDNSLGVFELRSEIFQDARGNAAFVTGLFADITEEVRRQERLETRALIDALTRVYNSAAARQQLEHRIAAFSGVSPDAFLILDVDEFKQVNDTLGHQAGDQVLQLMGRCLKAAVRDTDLVGRLGGDEFCLYLTGVPSMEFVHTLCRRIHTMVGETMREGAIGREITVSIGGAMIHAGDDFAAAYGRADHSLYESKRRGRNTFTIME